MRLNPSAISTLIGPLMVMSAPSTAPTTSAAGWSERYAEANSNAERMPAEKRNPCGIFLRERNECEDPGIVSGASRMRRFAYTIRL